jgi:carboxymethylenebutenolidase
VTINLQRHEMIEENIDIQTANGSMNTFVVFPEEDGPHPVVLFFFGGPG